MTSIPLKNSLQRIGLSDSALDALVHDQASQLASSVNNDGLDSQISFLTQTRSLSDEAVMAEALHNGCDVGDIVTGNCKGELITGRLDSIEDDEIIVIDKRNNLHAVAFNDIERIERQAT